MNGLVTYVCSDFTLTIYIDFSRFIARHVNNKDVGISAPFELYNAALHSIQQHAVLDWIKYIDIYLLRVCYCATRNHCMTCNKNVNNRIIMLQLTMKLALSGIPMRLCIYLDLLPKREAGTMLWSFPAKSGLNEWRKMIRSFLTTATVECLAVHAGQK
jgi:hypothetical protein